MVDEGPFVYTVPQRLREGEDAFVYTVPQRLREGEDAFVYTVPQRLREGEGELQLMRNLKFEIWNLKLENFNWAETWNLKYKFQV